MTAHSHSHPSLSMFKEFWAQVVRDNRDDEEAIQGLSERFIAEMNRTFTMRKYMGQMQEKADEIMLAILGVDPEIHATLEAYPHHTGGGIHVIAIHPKDADVYAWVTETELDRTGGQQWMVGFYSEWQDEALYFEPCFTRRVAELIATFYKYRKW